MSVSGTGSSPVINPFEQPMSPPQKEVSAAEGLSPSPEALPTGDGPSELVLHLTRPGEEARFLHAQKEPPTSDPNVSKDPAEMNQERLRFMKPPSAEENQEIKKVEDNIDNIKNTQPSQTSFGLGSKILSGRATCKTSR